MGLWMLAMGSLIATPSDRVLDALLALVMGVMIGGRLGYCVFYRPSFLWTFDASFPFWAVLRLNEGGMASHGGIIGVLVACWWISRGFRTDDGQRIAKAPVLHITDAVALVAPLGLMMGRIANFINGELLGRIAVQPAAQAATGEPAPAWSVRFPQERLSSRAESVEWTPAQEQQYIGLLRDYQLSPAEPEPEVVERMLGMVQSGSADLADRIAPLISARHPSQLYQAFAEGIVVLTVVWLVARRRRSPGLVSAAFLIVYGTGRVVTEFWRLPDAHFAAANATDLGGPTPLGLSRGQWLSVLMVVVGIAMLAWRQIKRTEARYLGWGVQPVPGVSPERSSGAG
ncbi:MAG: prolipoprotein diacylglyceryl transferase [Planctomycetota bacterium]